MRRRAALLALLIFLSLQSFEAEALGGEVIAELEVASKFVDRGLQLGDLTWHPSVEYAEGNLYAGVWAALPLEHKGAPDFFRDEYDFYAGYGWAVADRLAIDVGATYYRYPNAEDSLEGYLGIVSELGTFSPAIYIYNDFDLDTLTVELSSGFALPLEGLPTQIEARLGRVEGGEDYSYFEIDFLYPIELSDASRAQIGLHYSDNDFGFGVPDDHIYASASFSFSF